MVDHALRICIGVEHHLGSIKALLVELVEDAHERDGIVGIGKSIGYVEIQKVDIRQSQKLGVLAHDPRIVAVVVTVEGFPPPARAVVPIAIGATRRHRPQFVEDLLQVRDTVIAVFALTEEVEQANIALLLFSVAAHLA